MNLLHTQAAAGWGRLLLMLASYAVRCHATAIRVYLHLPRITIISQTLCSLPHVLRHPIHDHVPHPHSCTESPIFHGHPSSSPPPPPHSLPLFFSWSSSQASSPAHTFHFIFCLAPPASPLVLSLSFPPDPLTPSPPPLPLFIPHAPRPALSLIISIDHCPNGIANVVSGSDHTCRCCRLAASTGMLSHAV